METDIAKRWQSDVWCGTCKTYRTVEIPLNVGITEFLEGDHPCPACGQQTLRVSAGQRLPVPPAETRNS